MPDFIDKNVKKCTTVILSYILSDNLSIVEEYFFKILFAYFYEYEVYLIIKDLNRNNF